MTNASPPVRELIGEDVQVKVQTKPFCTVQLHVKASPVLVRKARKGAVKAVNKEVSLPGFRKGKAPEEVIEKKFAASIEKKLHKEIADLAYAEAQKLSKVPLLNHNAQITFDLKEQNEHGAELVFTFETEPTIPAVDPKLFRPQTVDRPEVGEKQINEAIRQMLFFYAKWTPIADRPIQEGDYIMIDLDTIEGETPQKVFRSVRFEVSKERMAKWMQTLVIGAKIGDVLEGLSEPDQDASEEEKKTFAPKKVRVVILNAEEASLPNLDDDFAKKVGVETVDAMRTSIEKLLNDQADQKVDAALRDQINEFLSTNFVFDLPQSLIEAEKRHRFQQALHNPSFKEKWTHMSDEEKASFEEVLKKESEQAVRLFYLSRQVVHDAKVPITHKEVQDEAIATVQSGRQTRVEIEKIPREIYALALSKVILRKAQDVILKETHQP